MFGSGVKTGMVDIVALLRPTLLVPLVGRAVCTVAAVCAIQPVTVVVRAVSTALRTSATAI